MPPYRTLLKSARLFHLYSGVFLAPALIFFAITGGLQTFSLHETTRGSSYKPPAILVKLGQLHKKQTLVVPERKSPSPAARSEAATSTDQTVPNKHALDLTHLGDHTNQQKHDRLDTQEPPKPASTPTQTTSQPVQPAALPLEKKQHLLPMKIFFLIASLGLFFSTLTGLYMSYTYANRKLYLNLSLIAGVLIPVVLLLIQ